MIKSLVIFIFLKNTHKQIDTMVGEKSITNKVYPKLAINNNNNKKMKIKISPEEKIAYVELINARKPILANQASVHTGYDGLVNTPEYDIAEGDELVFRKPRALYSNFSIILKSLRLMSGVTAKTSKQLETVLASSKIGLSPADVALRGAKITKSKHGYLKVNEVSVNEFNGYMRAGNLLDVLRVTGKKVHVTEAEQKFFSSLAKDLPERAIKKIEDIVKISAKERPHLNITVNNYDKLSEISKSDITSFTDNLLKVSKAGTYLVLVIGGVTIGVNWIRNGLADRRGCWMLRTVNGKTTSCRVSAFSCGRPSGNLSLSVDTVNSKQTCTEDLSSYYNATLSFIHICELGDTDLDKLNLAKSLGVSVDTMIENKTKMLETKFEAINNFVKAYTGNSTVNICKPNSAIDNGTVPYCRMCDPSANPRSTLYIDTLSMVGENVTFKCIENPTVLELMSDVVQSTGKNLWEGITSVPSTLFKAFKYVGIFTALALVFSLIYFIYRKFAFNTGNAIYDTNVTYESLKTARI